MMNDKNSNEELRDRIENKNSTNKVKIKIWCMTQVLIKHYNIVLVLLVLKC
jgi:hypothetical protein